MNKVRKEEELALELLKKHFLEYNGLKLSDKPDLVDIENSIGVEVTSASNPKVREREAFYWKELHGKKIQDIGKAQQNQGEEYGLSLVYIKKDGEIFSLARMYGAEEKELLPNAIKKKYSKKYQGLKKLDLYIFFRHFFIEGFSNTDLQGLFQTIHQCEKQYGKVFSRIMVDFYSKLLVLDVSNDSIKVHTEYNQ